MRSSSFSGELGDPRAVADLAITVVGGLPEFRLVQQSKLVGEGVGQGEPNRVLRPLCGEPGQQLMGAAGAVGADQHSLARPPARCVAWELRERCFEYCDVIRGGVGASVSLSEHEGKRFTRPGSAVICEGQQRVEPEAFLKGRGREFLVRMRGDQRRVDVDDDRVIDVGAVVRGVLAGCGPHPCPGRGTRGIDRLQHPVRVSGQGIDQPRHRRVRGHRPEHRRLGTQHRDVGQAVPADRECDRQIGHDLARIMPRQRSAPPAQRLR